MRPDRLLLGWLLLFGVLGFGAIWDAVDSERRPAATWCEQTQAGAAAFAEAVVEVDVAAIVPGILDLLIEPTAHAWWHARSFLVIGGLVVAALVALFGAALIRIDVARLVSDRDVSLVPAITHAARTWRRTYGTLIIAPVLALILLFPIIVVGIVAAIPGVSVVLSILWGILLIPAIGAALVVFGWLVSLPILSGAMALEVGDPAENVIRSFVLIRRRPVVFLLLLLLSLVALAVGWLIVSAVVGLTLYLLNAASGFVFSASPTGPLVTWPGLAAVAPADAEPGVWAHSIVAWWFRFAISWAWAWVVAVIMLFSGRTYLVMRRAVERLPLEEIDELEAS